MTGMSNVSTIRAVEEIDGLSPARTQTLADVVFDELVNAIVTGDIPPGAKIRETELARRFNVSRAPLREAIRRLEERRLVDRTAHVGARVVDLSPAVLIEIFLVREALEGMAARLAAERMSEAEVEELRDLLAGHERTVSETEVYYARESDWDFHYRVATGSRCPKLEQILCRDLYQLIRLYRYQHVTTPGRAGRALFEHRRVADAIADRDADLAELLMRRHISTARAVLQQSLSPAGVCHAAGAETKRKVGEQT